MEDEEPPSDRRGRYSDRSASYRSFGGGRGRNTSSWGKRSNDDGDWSGGWKPRRSYGEKSSSGMGRGSSRPFSMSDSNRRSYGEKSSSGMGRGSSRPFSMSDSNRSFRGSCFVCGQSGHRASDCPQN